MTTTAIGFHPAADIFPLLEGSALAELVADVRTNGLREPIVLHPDGRVLDGRNRFRACLVAEVEPRYRTWDGIGSPIAYVVSLNLHRRHLDTSQRALVAARIANLQRGDNRFTIDPAIAVSTEQASELLNVSGDSVSRAREVLEHGAPELVQAVERGDVAVSTAAAITDLAPAEQREVIARGEKEILHAAKQIRTKKLETRRQERVEKLAEISKADPVLATDQTFPVIYADPPWRYEHVETESRAIENQYPTMALDDICGLEIPSESGWLRRVNELATSDALLFLWATSPKLSEAMRVIEAWGFTYRTSMVWVKEQIGMGYYARQRHELLLIATKGNPPVPAPADRPDSVVIAPRTEHSEKPAVFYDAIERMYPSLPKIELFSRSVREGWTAWGNQAA